MQHIKPQRSIRRNKKAMSPAVSTMILTAAVIVMILVAMSYANNFLSRKMAENEYSVNKQFMLTTGLQIDDIAWTIGRIQTVRYSSDYGSIKGQTAALNYTFEAHTTSGWQAVFSNITAMVMFIIPTSMYSLGNNYFERLIPTTGSFVQQGASAPTCQVFCIEKLPMNDGSYIRIVVVPSIRVLNSTISSTQSTTNYTKFYFPTLQPAISNPYNSQSLTMIGNDTSKISINGVDQVRITVSFPNQGSGFDSTFFGFNQNSITLNSTSSIKMSPGIAEFYIGKVLFTIGQV